MEVYQKAERVAQEAVLRAAQLSAGIGAHYTPPPNVNVNLQEIKMVCHPARNAELSSICEE